MSIEKEYFDKFPKGLEDCLKGCGLENLVFNGNYTEAILQKPISKLLPNIVEELTDNCLEKGAKNIIVTLTDNSLMVEDDFVEKNPEKTLKLLKKIINTGKKVTTKRKVRLAAGCKPDGGIGIAEIVVGGLKQFGGSLDYYIKDGKIVAEAKWE